MPSKKDYLRLRPTISALGYKYELAILDAHYELVHLLDKEGKYMFTL